MKIQVLDFGHVEYVSHMGDDLTVVNAARVSFNKESEWDKERDWRGGVIDKTLLPRDSKLISYLAKHEHWTPFAHPQITLRIKAPMFVRAQLGKHQVGFVMNEVSRRYVTDDPEISEMYDTVCYDSLDVYKELLKQGVAPEQARAVLPQSTYTEWWWTGSLAGYARVYKQRIDAHAQWEVQEFAKAIGEVISPLYPVSWRALVEETKYEAVKGEA